MLSKALYVLYHLLAFIIYTSGVTRGLGQGGEGKLVPLIVLKYEIISGNFNDAEKSKQCSNITRKFSGSNNLGAWGRSPQPPEAKPSTLRQFFQLFPKK